MAPVMQRSNGTPDRLRKARAAGDRRHKSQRHEEIIARLNGAPAIRASELAALLEVSGETIRRDLVELDEKGLISRTYGGALRPFALEPEINERSRTMPEERKAIGARLASMIAPNEVLMIGAGATTQHVALQLSMGVGGFTAITHDFNIARTLARNPTISVLFCPGRYHPNEGYVYGAQTIASINSYEANRAIVGATGFSERGINDANDEAGAIYSAMVKRAAEAIVVADNSKFDQRALIVYAQWHEITKLVTDVRPTGRLEDAIESAGTEIIIA